jgi:ABC-type lipoprotein export system ATPase subunit
MLVLKEVSKSFAGPNGTVEAIKGVSLSVKAGQVITVQGPSGSGKSTLLLAAGALLRPDSGTILIDGQDTYALNPNGRSSLRAEKIGFVFQQFHLVPYLSVLDNVLAPSVARPSTDSADRAKELINHFQLTDRMYHLPAQLSTGQRQRTALARALLNKPKIILADEPTGNLDNESGRVVLGYLAEFARQGGAVLIVTHDSEAIKFADRNVILRDGQIAM